MKGDKEQPIQQIENFGAQLVRKHLIIKEWLTYIQKILNLPEWMQEIVLDDINTAIKNRITWMEVFYKKEGGKENENQRDRRQECNDRSTCDSFGNLDTTVSCTTAMD